ncbi:MAG: Crp/Fnr family transcriptional regulator [Clostridia bacterium]|nr:Crp/Fnr family transcriptional regulator [Clostridia bacterium]
MTESQKNRLISILKNSFLFNGVDEESVEAFVLSKGISQKTFSNGEVVENANSPCLSFVMEGCVRVFGQNQGKRVLLNTLFEGDAFGVARLFCREDTSVSEIVSKGTARVCFIPFENVERLVSTDGKVAANYISFLSEKIRFLNSKIGQYTAKSGEIRLVKYLLSLKEDENGVVALSLPMSRLASHLGVSRATLYRSMDELENQGHIERKEKNKIKIINLKQLLTERND